MIYDSQMTADMFTIMYCFIDYDITEKGFYCTNVDMIRNMVATRRAEFSYPLRIHDITPCLKFCFKRVHVALSFSLCVVLCKNRFCNVCVVYTDNNLVYHCHEKVLFISKYQISQVSGLQKSHDRWFSNLC